MENFTYFNPTKLHFGKGVLADVGKTVTTYGKRVLLVYGRGSVKRSGLYDSIMANLKNSGVEVIEYGGIKPNPGVEDVDKAAGLGRNNNVDVVLAVGGGSVIDSAKIISITIPVNHTAWDFYAKKAVPAKAVPLIAVLTLAATGTEMNPFAVLQNEKAGRKDGFTSDLIFPAHSFLDPEVTFTVPPVQTAYGIADLIAHCFETYFSKGDCSLSDRFIFSIIADAMEWAPALLKNLTGYEERAAIMYDATLALNLLTANGKGAGDWGVHAMGHLLSLKYDVPHGASLSILFPAWLKIHRDRCPGRIQKLGAALANTTDIDETIRFIENFFRSVGAPVRLSEVGIGVDKHEEIISNMVRNRAQGNNFKMSPDDHRKLVELMA